MWISRALSCALVAALLHHSTAIRAEGQTQRAGGGTASDRQLPRWTVESTPVFSSQASQRGDSVLLLRPLGATRLRDGTVVVADDGTKQVKWFREGGRLVRVFGRDGDGPGEFRLARLVGSCAEGALHVYDGAASRLTTVSTRGELVSTRLVHADAGQSRTAYALGCGQSGTLVIFGWPQGPLPNGDAPFLTEMSISVQSIDGSLTRQIGTIKGPERQRFGSNIGPRPLGTRTSMAVAADRVYLGVGDAPTVRVLALSGRPLPSIQLPFVQQNITRPDINRYIQELVARNPGRSPARIREDYESVAYPEKFPAFGDLMVDAAQLLWVEQHRRPGEYASRWLVFDPSGRARGEVVLPSHFRAIEVGADWILGTWEDSDGAQHVRVLRLKRP